MKKKAMKALREKLLVAIKKVVKDNKAYLSNKGEKNLKESIKRIVKKTNKEKSIIPAKKSKRSVLHSGKYKMDGIANIKPSKQMS